MEAIAPALRWPKAGRRRWWRWSPTAPTPVAWPTRRRMASPPRWSTTRRTPRAQAFDDALARVIDGFAPDLVRAGRLHAHPRRRLRAPLRRADAQHPPLAAAGLPGPAHAPAGARGRLQGGRRHGALRDARARPRPDRACRAWCRCWPGDDEHALAARVLATEHAIYPLAVRWFVEGRLRVEDGIVSHTGGASQVPDRCRPPDHAPCTRTPCSTSPPNCCARC